MNKRFIKLLTINDYITREIITAVIDENTSVRISRKIHFEVTKLRICGNQIADKTANNQYVKLILICSASEYKCEHQNVKYRIKQTIKYDIAGGLQ